MSYILEALRKMERQKRRDRQGESWIDVISVEPEQTRRKGKNPGRFLVGISVLFGVAGILAGLMFHNGHEAAEGDAVTLISAGSAGNGSESAVKGTGRVEDGTTGARTPDGFATKLGPNSSRGVTLSEIRSRYGIRENGGEPIRVAPKGTPDDSSISFRPEGAKGVIDLTHRCRLTSTGEANQKKYATIDKQDYHIGDEFKGLVITGIEKDRVHLSEKKGDRQYVIIFRYGR